MFRRMMFEVGLFVGLSALLIGGMMTVSIYAGPLTRTELAVKR